MKTPHNHPLVHATTRLTAATALLTWLVAASAQAQTEPPKPGPERAKLGMMVGYWSYEGEAVDALRGTKEKFAGKVISRFVLGGFFVEDKWEEKTPSGNYLSGIQLFGYDATTKGYFVNGISSDGGRQTGTMTIEGDTITSIWTQTSGKGEKSLVKGVWKYSSDQTSFTATWQLSLDEGKTWGNWLEYKATKLKK